MQWSLADARVAQVSGRSDFLWLRILDVVRALEARTYERDGSVVLEILDDLGGRPGPAAGRYRRDVAAGSAACARTETRADLTIDVRALGAALLGGTRLVNATRGSG